MSLAFLEGAGAGFLVGVFCPALARKIKALFVKESKAAQSAAGQALSTAEAAATQAAANAVKKL